MKPLFLVWLILAGGGADPQASNCFLRECGCPGAFLQPWCSELTASVLSEVCSESSGNCEGSCSSTWCAPVPVSSVCSALSCWDLKWTHFMKLHGDEGVCGGNPGECSGLVTWAKGRDLCEAQGARLCTAGELVNNEARGCGCGYDNQLVWSSSPCTLVEGSSRPGFEATHGAQAGSRTGQTWCLDPEYVTTNVRCCADAEPCDDPTPAPSASPTMPVPTATPTLTPSAPPTLLTSSNTAVDNRTTNNSSVDVNEEAPISESPLAGSDSVSLGGSGGKSSDGNSKERSGAPSSAGLGMLGGGLALLLLGTAAYLRTASCSPSWPSPCPPKARLRREEALDASAVDTSECADDEEEDNSPMSPVADPPRNADLEQPGATDHGIVVVAEVVSVVESTVEKDSQDPSYHPKSCSSDLRSGSSDGGGGTGSSPSPQSVFIRSERGSSADRSPPAAHFACSSSQPQHHRSCSPVLAAPVDDAGDNGGDALPLGPNSGTRQHPVAIFLEGAGIGKFLPALEEALSPAAAMPRVEEGEEEAEEAGISSSTSSNPRGGSRRAAAAMGLEHVYGVAIWDPLLLGDARLVAEFGFTKKDVKCFRVALQDLRGACTAQHRRERRRRRHSRHTGAGTKELEKVAGAAGSKATPWQETGESWRPNHHHNEKQQTADDSDCCSPLRDEKESPCKPLSKDSLQVSTTSNDSETDVDGGFKVKEVQECSLSSPSESMPRSPSTLSSSSTRTSETRSSESSAWSEWSSESLNRLSELTTETSECRTSESDLSTDNSSLGSAGSAGSGDGPRRSEGGDPSDAKSPAAPVSNAGALHPTALKANYAYELPLSPPRPPPTGKEASPQPSQSGAENAPLGVALPTGAFRQVPFARKASL